MTHTMPVAADKILDKSLSNTSPHHTTTDMQPLGQYAHDVYSQDGEDGILFEILTRLGVIDSDGPKWVVEFGAWDGVHLSNSCNLIRNHGFSAVLIEANTKRFKELCTNIPQSNVHKINRFVALEGDQRLDAILTETPIPEDFDLISIDIDGCDYHIWDSLEAYRPKAVIIEFNPTIPVDVPFINPRDFSVQQGSGVKAMDDLARAKGYTSVFVKGGNLFAVRDDLVHLVCPDTPPSIEEMADPDARMFLFVGYDGTLLSNKAEVPMLWHPTNLSVGDMQPLPRKLRRFSGHYGPLQWGWFGLLDYSRRARRWLRGSNSN